MFRLHCTLQWSVVRRMEAGSDSKWINLFAVAHTDNGDGGDNDDMCVR